MDEINILARAKINLTLEVLNKREDNYHDIESIFQKISLYDEINIYKVKDKRLILESNIEELNNESNIIYKAYMEMDKRFKLTSGVRVVLKKNIPMQAGLAGGSTDCASFVLGMNKLFDLKLSEDEIIDLCKNLGADVVPCLYNKAVIAKGIGDEITKINTNFNYYILILKPSFSCNTGEMFRLLDQKERTINCEKHKCVIKALEENNIELLTNNLYNTFEEVVDVKSIKEILIENKAIGALLTGSGSCVYGIFKNKEDATFAYDNLKDKYEAYMCTSYNDIDDEILL